MPLTPEQAARRDRIEKAIAAAAPFLDLVLEVGERISRIVDPRDSEYYPIRPGGRVALPGEEDYDREGDSPAAVPPPSWRDESA